MLAAGTSGTQRLSVTAALDRYLAGDFDRVLAEVAAARHFDDLLDDLKRGAPGWIEAGGASERDRRELAAATFAMEAARAAASTSASSEVLQINLNLTTTEPPLGAPPAPNLPNLLDPANQSYQALPLVHWKPPARLLEWGCERLRQRLAPLPLERIWHLAAIATAERAGMVEFMIGSPVAVRGNAKDEIEHLNHVIERFPHEPRFVLAQGVALEQTTWPVGFRIPRYQLFGATLAEQALRLQVTDDAIGPEATMRLGFLRFRMANPDQAIEMFDRVEATTRDRYVVYLARYFRGLALESKNRLTDAQRAYRGALSTIPRAQSATAALATLLVSGGRSREAAALVEASLTPPIVQDPWREYEAADDRFWPELIARLHGAIAAPSGPAR